jgi:hypothetical protein
MMFYTLPNNVRPTPLSLTSSIVGKMRGMIFKGYCHNTDREAPRATLNTRASKANYFFCSEGYPRFWWNFLGQVFSWKIFRPYLP